MWVPTSSRENPITACIKRPYTPNPKPFVQTLPDINTIDKPISMDDFNNDPPNPIDPKKIQEPVFQNIGPTPDDEDDTWESAHWCA